MKLKSLLLLPLLTLPLGAQEYAFDISSVPGASLLFSGVGDTFQFLPESGDFDFEVDRSDFDDLSGVSGRIEGTFTIGTILNPGTAFETALVSGLGTFSLVDALGFAITADLAWNDIHTVDLGNSSGGLNLVGFTNLTNFSDYAGINQRLASFMSNDGEVTLSFEFSPGRSLSELTADLDEFGQQNFNTTSYSGDVIVQSTLAAIPEPAGTTAVAGLLVLGFAIAMQVTRPRRDGADI